jgi:hypothetical protein
MNPLIIWGIMAGVILILSVTCAFFGYKLMIYRSIHKANVAIVESRHQQLEENLELATSEQLLGELRKRPGVPYLMISPVQGEDHQGVSIEIHNIPPVPCLQMLHVATAMTFKTLKERGVPLPDFPFTPPTVEGDEWKFGGNSEE